MRKIGYRDGLRVRNNGNGGGNNNGGGGQQGGGSPVFTSSSTPSVQENATLSHTLTATQNPTFSIVGGADQAQFEISGSTLRWSSNGTRNYEVPADADTNNTYVVTVRATKGSKTTDQTITVTVTDVASDDPYFSSVVLLMGFEGADASTSFDDESTPNHTMTAVGNAQIDTAQFKFGASSLLLDGAGDRITTPDSADWNFGSGAFTIECWARFAATETAANVFCSQWNSADSSRNWAFDYFNNLIRFSYTTGGTSATATTLTFAWTQSGGTWFHFAVCRDGSGDIRAFVDGTQIGSTQAANVTFFDGARELWIGAIESATPGNDFNGHMDELRITKGVARYTANFTAPTAAFPRL